MLLILASVSITVVFGDNGILQLAKEAGEKTNEAVKNDISSIGELEDILHETQTGIKVDKVTDAKPGELEVDASNVNLFTINSIEDLVFFAHDVTNGNTYADKTVKLGLSLDFASTKSYVDANRTDYGEYGYNGNLKTLLTSGEGFLPIGAILGYNDKEHSFNGTFDGNEKYIINLRIHKELIDNKNDLNIGLFANNYGTIKKLGIVNCDISGTLTSEVNSVHSGGISGVNFNEINNCFVSGQISSTGLETAKSRAGGISAVGRVFKDCYNLATITCKGNSYVCVGGICGGNDGESTSLVSCYNQGEVTKIGLGTGSYVGGITGYYSEPDTIKIDSCYNIGNITIKNKRENEEVYVRWNSWCWVWCKLE